MTPIILEYTSKHPSGLIETLSVKIYLYHRGLRNRDLKLGWVVGGWWWWVYRAKAITSLALVNYGIFKSLDPRLDWELESY